MEDWQDELLLAWRSWDAKPTGQGQVDREIAACKRAGEALGVSHIEVHERVAAARRAGLGLQEAVEALRTP